MTTTVPVSGGDFRPYEVVVGRGLLAELGPRVAPLARGRTVVITDETVAGLHGKAALASWLLTSTRNMPPPNTSSSSTTHDNTPERGNGPGKWTQRTSGARTSTGSVFVSEVTERGFVGERLR